MFGGKAVSKAGDVRTALTAAQASGKHSVLMPVKTADATKLVAVTLTAVRLELRISLA